MNITIVAHADTERDRDGCIEFEGALRISFPATIEEAATQIADLRAEDADRPRHCDAWEIHLLFDGREAEVDSEAADMADGIMGLASVARAGAMARRDERKRLEAEVERRKREEGKAREEAAQEASDRRTFERLKQKFEAAADGTEGATQ